MVKRRGKSEGFSIFWLVWVVAAVVVELVAVRRKQSGDTLSENEWAVTGVKGDRLLPAWLAWPLRVIVAGFLVWLIPHFTLGIWG